MYQQYFGLTESPFSIAPDPRYLYLSDKHREALAHLIYGVGDQGGFVLLTGEVGTGKTTICRCLLQQVPDNAEIAFIINPRQSINQLLQSVFSDLGLPYHKGDTSKDLIDQLNSHLLDAHSRGINTILIIDEAQNLSVDVLEQLRLLTNLETNEKKLLQLVLLGQPELNDLLAKPELRQLAQRVTARYHLAPLSKLEIAEYIEHRLAIAGCRAELFPSSSIKTIFQLSKGVPRLINLICDRTLLGIYATNQQRATPAIVKKASKEIFAGKAAFPKQYFVVLGVALACLIAVLLWFFFSGETETELGKSTGLNTVLSERVGAMPPAQYAYLKSSTSFADLQTQLFGLWGLPVEKDGNLCGDDSLLPNNSYCVTSTTSSLSDLEAYNSPAVVSVSSENGLSGVVLLKAIGKSLVTLTDGGQNYSVPREEFYQLKIGESFRISRIPSPLDLPITPGDYSEQVASIRALFMAGDSDMQSIQFTAIPNVTRTGSVISSKASIFYQHHLLFDVEGDVNLYDPALVSTVKQLQEKLGLAQTAIIDWDLLMAFSLAMYKNDPVLATFELEDS